MYQHLSLSLSPRLFAWGKALLLDGFQEIFEVDIWMRYFTDW